MGARLLRQMAEASALLILASGVSAQTTDTECRTIGGVLRCTSKTTEPLNDAEILQRGMDLVPRYVPTPRPSEPQPPPRAAKVVQTTWIESGNDLMAACEKQEFACFVYVQASVDGFAVAMQITDAPKRVCIPEGVTQGQSVDVVMAEMKRSPENRHWPAAAVVMYALIKAFPCSK